MDDLRKSAQAALEALDESMQMLLPKEQSDKARRAAFSLKAALAQPEPEPVAWMYEHDGCMDLPILTTERWPQCKEPWNEASLYLHPPAQPEQQAKPMANSVDLSLGLEPETGGACNVCGGGLRYGERHVRCGDAVMRAVSAERERCAKVCEQADDDGEGPDCWGWHAKDYAKAIRKS